MLAVRQTGPRPLTESELGLTSKTFVEPSAPLVTTALQRDPEADTIRIRVTEANEVVELLMRRCV